MKSTNFPGKNHGLQIGDNYGPINFAPDNCIRDLFVTSPRDDKEALKRKKKRHAAGTCEWILCAKELTAWLGSGPTVGPQSQTAQVLWLHGNPGIGKSTMAIYLTEELPTALSKAGGGTLAYFFCDSGFDTRKTATSVIRGLLYQLIERHEELLNYLLPKYHARGANLFTSFDALWEIFMAMAADPTTGRKYCIIDALDECDRESQKALLQQLEDTFGSREISPNIRILVTSRPYPEIRESLEIFPNKDLASFPQRVKDMDLFIEEKINSLARRKRYTSKVEGQVRRILRDKSEGTFLWVGLACDELEDVPSKDAVRVLQDIPRGLNSLYEKLLEESLKWSETSRDIIWRLLSWVALSLRPLTVSQLSEACELHQEEEDIKTKLQFTYEDIEACRLIIIIQDEKVLLLHKSIKDYLVGTKPSNFIPEFEAHARLAYRCVNILIEQFHRRNKRNSSFLNYASREWPNHARMAKSSFKVQIPQEEFLQIISPSREWWLQQLRSEPFFYYIPGRFSIFHIAGKWGICALVDHASKLEVQKSDKEGTCHVLPVDCVDDSGKIPLSYGAESGYLCVVDAFLSLSGKVTPPVVKAAARNWMNGKAVMELLLDRYGDQITITDEVVKAAAGNQRHGKAVMELLLDRYGDQITITDEVVKAAAGNQRHGKAVMELLLDRCGDQITITNEIVEVAARNGSNGKEVIQLLLDHCGDQITITHKIVEAVARNWRDGKAVLELLLDHCGDQITITHTIVEAVARNWRDGKAVLELLLDRYGDQITITHKIVKAVARNQRHGKAVMGLLLDRYGDQITITDKTVEAAAGNQRHGKAMIELLLDYLGDQLTITDEVVETAASKVGMRRMTKQ
ncbi:Pfs NACHT and Ankyrin domain protein [Penicillium chermesinum]|uniref:Pfs NACHT and Ankyrin domain protein n=1 Tax=Penicillium chermesinum TaxID=63820 RepID=A0A9W9N828_9EURO|nr:Pfs NACHT and Ankyrin domain protein [Penicillium chermesinum]KAJ5214978.1 Pfs NACHT and Ankyrin domain protein [Penicillium chermesinum]